MPKFKTIWQKEYQKWEKTQLHHHLAKTYLTEYETSAATITKDDINELISTIENSRIEEDVQKFLKLHPGVLTRHLGGGHGRYCIPKPSLAGAYYPDFLLADLSSLGLTWHAVELENPQANMFNKGGDPRAALNHAIMQVREWRNWLMKNLDEATRPIPEKGLGSRRHRT